MSANWPQDDGGFAPEMTSIEGICNLCGLKFSKVVSKDSATRHRFCYSCKQQAWMPVTYDLGIEEFSYG